ncbi:helix-turn-helix domain-containing protein [Candidatus Pacearchaeota archaeon]|nr:helix-turn-helix domain-containing protein [Candidatus Pacearchaeota archaeon]
MSTTINKEELTVQDLTVMFKVSRRTIWVWRRDNELPYYRLSSTEGGLAPVRFNLDDVTSWATAQGKIIHRVITILKPGKISYIHTKHDYFDARNKFLKSR